MSCQTNRSKTWMILHVPTGVECRPSTASAPVWVGIPQMNSDETSWLLQVCHLRSVIKQRTAVASIRQSLLGNWPCMGQHFRLLHDTPNYRCFTSCRCIVPKAFSFQLCWQPLWPTVLETALLDILSCHNDKDPPDQSPHGDRCLCCPAFSTAQHWLAVAWRHGGVWAADGHSSQLRIPLWTQGVNPRSQRNAHKPN